MAARVSHVVFFELVDASDEKVQTLLEQCKQYLDDHPGLEFFAVGRLNPDLARDVNDRDFHVSLHTVFTDMAAHDAYQIAARHKTFIENNRDNWKTVRVFDSDLEA